MTVNAVQGPAPLAVPVPSLVRVGAGHPVVVVETITGQVPAVRAIAAALAPFPPATQYYPGVRRVLAETDGAAWTYANTLARAAATYIAGAFDCDGFTLLEASFSIVTTPPADLRPPQRAPHFDGTDPDLIAMLHFLGDAPGSGTAFFRHRATGIEQVADGNVASFVAAATRERGQGYVQGSNAHFEEIARFDAVPDRLLIYQGSLLHSGIIPPSLPLSADPLVGRLTANYFIKLTR